MAWKALLLVFVFEKIKKCADVPFCMEADYSISAH